MLFEVPVFLACPVFQWSEHLLPLGSRKQDSATRRGARKRHLVQSSDKESGIEEAAKMERPLLVPIHRLPAASLSMSFTRLLTKPCVVVKDFHWLPS